MIVGDTTVVPPLTVNNDAPVGLIVKLCPEQILPLFTLKVGVIFTVTLLTTGVAVHPSALVPVTV